MLYPNLRNYIQHRHICQRDLAPLLKRSDGYFNDRMNGRYNFLFHEKNRIAEFLGVTDVAWLFAPYQPPPVLKRETAMLEHPAMETR